MIEVQCPSCQTRYRIEESVLPQDSPTFKCSRCGHVFSGDPRLTKRPAAPASKPRPPKAPQDAAFAQAAPSSTEPQTRGVQPPRPTNPRAEAAAPPTQASNAAADQQSGAIPKTSSGGASENLQGGFHRPPQSQRTAPAAASGTTYAPPPRLASSSRPPAPSRPDRGEEAGGQAENPLARSFADEEAKTPENLTFDFGDETSEHHQLGEPGEPAENEDRYDQWRVGDPERQRGPAAQPLTPEMARYQARRAAIMQTSRRVDLASVAAEASEHARVRSSGFFLGLFALIVAGFAIFTFVLGLSPSLSREVLARLPIIGDEFTPVQPRQSPVSLRDVHAQYRLLDGKRRALIVSGQAENRGAEPLHTIEVGVSLVDNQQHPVLSQSVFCGDLVSPKIVSQMTPHELQFFQKLAPPKNFALKSGDSSPFFVMFINPPPNVANFQVSVLKAEPASGDSMAAAGI